MRQLLLPAFLLLLFDLASAQKNIQTTNEFVVEGQVKNNLVVKLEDLKGYPLETIDSVVIMNHLGQRKSALKNIKGISLKRILEKVEIQTDSPKQLSEFYFIFVATDDYKVVFSWNEIFNNKTGEGIYLIAGKDGKEIEDLDDRIAVFSQTDVMTGRRYVKGLKKIMVKRAE